MRDARGVRYYSRECDGLECLIDDGLLAGARHEESGREVKASDIVSESTEFSSLIGGFIVVQDRMGWAGRCKRPT